MTIPPRHRRFFTSGSRIMIADRWGDGVRVATREATEADLGVLGGLEGVEGRILRRQGYLDVSVSRWVAMRALAASAAREAA